jgi:hypothetical protein
MALSRQVKHFLHIDMDTASIRLQTLRTVLDDGVELGIERNHSVAYVAGEVPLSELPATVRPIVSLIWTQEAIAAQNAREAANRIQLQRTMKTPAKRSRKAKRAQKSDCD